MRPLTSDIPELSPSPYRRRMALLGFTAPEVAEMTGLKRETLLRFGRGEGSECGTLCLIAVALEAPLGPLIAYQLRETPPKERPRISMMPAPLPRDLPAAWDYLEAERVKRGLRVNQLPGSTRTYYEIRRGEPKRPPTFAQYALALDLDLTTLVCAHGMPRVIERGL